MTERHEIEELSAPEREVREIVRALPRPRPREAFRDRLRADFTAGRLGAKTIAFPKRRRPWFAHPAVWAPVAAAAAFACVFVYNRGPDWRVIAAGGDAPIVVGDRPVSPQHAGELAGLLRRGGHVRIPANGSLDLVAPGELAVSLAPGAEVDLPAAPNRLWSRAVRARVRFGDTFFSTGRAFHGATFDVETDQAVAHVVGTSFAVLTQPGGTCVCVMEGRVRVTSRAGDVAMVPAGKRRILYDGEPPVTAPVLAYSEHALHHLKKASADALGR